jgi:hypothetical protein
MRDFEVGIAPALAEDAPELPAVAFDEAALDDDLFEAAIIAFSSFSVTPAFVSRIISLVEVLNLLGRDLISETMTESGTFFLLCMSAITSSLVIGFGACWASDKVWATKTAEVTNINIRFRI